MIYFIVLGILFSVATYVFYRINILDIYLLAVGAASLVMSVMIGLWLEHTSLGIVLFIVGLILLISMLYYRSKQVY